MKIDPSDTVRLRAATSRNMTLKFTVPLREGSFERGCWNTHRYILIPIYLLSYGLFNIKS